MKKKEHLRRGGATDEYDEYVSESLSLVKLSNSRAISVSF